MRFRGSNPNAIHDRRSAFALMWAWLVGVRHRLIPSSAIPPIDPLDRPIVERGR
jgi:hypothetical protein